MLLCIIDGVRELTGMGRPKPGIYEEKIAAGFADKVVDLWQPRIIKVLTGIARRYVLNMSTERQDIYIKTRATVGSEHM